MWVVVAVMGCSAVFLAVGLVYYLRLPDPLREKLSTELRDKAASFPHSPWNLSHLVGDETQKYVDNLQLEEGIAKTQALKVCELSRTY